MSTYSSTLHKRKSAKNKQQANNTTTVTTLNTTNLDSAAVATTSGAAQNERLQRAAQGDKLDFNNIIRKQLKQTPYQQQQPQQQHLSAFKLCNGLTGVVQCCRDINCHMNTPMRESSVSTVSSFNSNVSNDIASYSSTSASSRNSKSNSPSPLPQLQNTQQHQQQQQTFHTVSRDSSPDSGLGSDGTLSSSIMTPFLEHEFTISLKVDLFSWILFLLGLITRFYSLTTPSSIVFDELHYGKYISFYMRNMFFFDQHPPLGKQLIAAAASFAGYDGNCSFSHIGADYKSNVPVFWLRFVPALCGSLLAPTVYKLLLEARLKRWTALLGGLMVICDNALLTQSRFVLMESMLLLFSTLGLYFLLQFQRSRYASPHWILCSVMAACMFTCAVSVKYVGFLSGCLAAYLMSRYLWNLLYDAHASDFQIILQTVARSFIFIVIPVTLYLSIFYVHLQTLHHAGPHDSVMTSAFQASLDGGLASITRSQPLRVVHGSQITLRHTLGRTCWLHSHAQVYPVRYPDKRGSSHQQQVTCYSFKDVNNWWIVKRPEKDDLIVDDDPVPIRDGDIIQLVHGITSRALNSHDVAAPMTPQCQEVSCYIDYKIDMAGELLWRVQILNKDTEGPVWHAIKSKVRLIHQSTGTALRFSGRILPDWGYNQHEIVADRAVENEGTIWNVEEHRYTKTHDQSERERQLLNAEMIPTKKTKLSFWEKFIELQTKMLWNPRQLQSHMYSSDPLEWPLLDKGIAYWVDRNSNRQIHLLGNIVLWYSATFGVFIYAALGAFYLVRRHRLCYDLPPKEWQHFLEVGDIFFIGYLIHYLPYFFVDQTLFLHHYLPALLFKMMLLCCLIEHIDYLLRHHCGHALWLVRSFRLGVLLWFTYAVVVFVKFLPFSYGIKKLSKDEIIQLRWKDTWDFILHKEHALN